jgi:transglutaminase-like putative cysteine protease
MALLCCGAAPIWAAPPDWLQAASREALPKYADDVRAVMLRNDQIATVKNNGEVTTIYRRAYRILRPEGRSYGTVEIYYDSETRISSLKAWTIPASGSPYELGEKDSVDTILFTGNLYEDDRKKVLQLPAPAAGAVIGYEYEQRQRPSIFQEKWLFQQEVPVRQARLQVNLPSGWEYREVWANHAAVPLQPGSANQMIWELRDIAAIPEERAMPPLQATAGQLLLTYIRPGAGASMKSWRDVGQWYAQLVADRRQPTPELRQKVAELTAGAPTIPAKIQALASFVQREVRYVAIEIGIGGYQPHPAQDIFRNRYGDCKDKATLLSTMLREIGVESYYVLISTHRGVVRQEFASPLGFNHAILAVRLPADYPTGGLHGVVQHPQLGQLLFFDPTSEYVPYGELPVELQANNGLVVSDTGGELVKLPLAPAEANSFQRTLNLQLGVAGSLQGEAREVRTGAPAADFRGGWLNASQAERQKDVQSMFGQLNTAAEVKNVSVANLDQPEADPVLTYQVRLPGYVKNAGSLVLLRPALSDWADDVLERGERSQPLTFRSAMQRIEVLEITLPEGYAVDELPAPVQADIGIASYSSRTDSDGRVLRYTRRLQINDVLVNNDRLADMKKFYRQVNVSEKTATVFKKR